MPLPKRTIEPVYVARSIYAQNLLPSELETVTNTTLTNIVRQLSSLSRHSEDLFGELGREANKLAERANSLQARIDRLSIKVTQLDSTVEEVSLTEIQLKKAFKSASNFDQQIFSRLTMSTAMLETYQMCDMPPPLDKLNCYRDDGKDGLKFYTDPNYFFELWRQEMLKDTDKIQKDKRQHRNKTGQNPAGAASKHRKQKPRQPHSTLMQHQQAAIQRGEAIMPANLVYITPTMMSEDSYSYGGGQRPNSIEIRSNYQHEGLNDGIYIASPLYDPQNNYAGASHVDSMIQYGGYQLHQAENPYAPGTPTRRPSQPPPAPPVASSGNGTPTMSNAGTPTRRSTSNVRDNLPPPPPVPLENALLPLQMANNGGPLITSKFVGRNNNNRSRSDSPQQAYDQNTRIMQQLENDINQLNSQMNDLPPPPPIPTQISPKVSPPSSAPPPPPPPFPVIDVYKNHIDDESHSIGASNGLLVNQLSHQIQHQAVAKKTTTPFPDDNRSDLMKAIRNGIKLRKVEREHKESREIKPPLDVASILARRVAIELSSESSESEEDDEEWNEQSIGNAASA